MKVGKEERDEALKHLRKLLKPGDTVHTVLRHVSSSGMSRRIDLYLLRKGEAVYLSGYASKVLGLPRHPQKEGLTVGGCGMDMGFHLVYELSHALFPKGFKVGRKGTRARNGDKSGYDSDGGYALRQTWI